ncbi:MAG: Major cardiolipin synthase ClsA [Desulfovibrio sp.]
MRAHTPEPPPSQAMPERYPPSHRSIWYVIAALFVGLCLFLVLDKDSFLHGMIYKDIPFSWDNVFVSLKAYGYWLFTIYLISTGLALFFENRNPDRTVAWLLVLALLPFVGLVLYWLVGPNFRYLADKRRFRLPKPRSVAPHNVCVADFTPMMTDTAMLMYRTSGARLLNAGLSPLPLYDGAATFAHIKDRLRRAENYILLESYIIKNDATGNAIKDILIERAQAGVFVCMVYDAVGSWKIGKGYLEALRTDGVHTRAFLPVAFPMFRGANYRNHRKIIVVDGDTAYLGGMNIGDEYAGLDPHLTSWRDAHLELGGEAVAALHAIFVNDLAACCRDTALVERVRCLPVNTGAVNTGAVNTGAVNPGAEAEVSEPQDDTVCTASVPVQIIASGPDTPWDTIHKAYLSLISRSRKTLWMTTPYLVPGDALMEAICMASLSGVDVRMMLPGKSDHPIVQWASMNCCDELLRSGVRIFLYDAKGFIHAKTIVCDGALLSVGSANLDTRSLQINFEVQAFLYDKTLAAEAERVFEADMANSRELTFMSWRQRPKIERVKESVGKLFSSLL